MGHWSEQEAEWATGVNRRLSGPLTGLEVLEKCNNCSNCWHSYPGHSNAVTGRKTREKKKRPFAQHRIKLRVENKPAIL